MIYLLTGTPGHGKTQRAIAMLLNDKRFVGRPVLYANVRGLKTDDERLKNWIPLTDVTQWETAPTGAVIFVDECHQEGFFPTRGVGKPPKWIEAIATHRHLGLDFVLVTQNAKSMDVFVRRLVELHMHCKRPAQMPYTNVYEFQGFTDCDDRIPTSSALRHSRWQLDKTIWSLYESADEHTSKAKPPRVLFLVPVLLFAFVAAGWYAWNWGQQRQKPASQNPVGAAGLVAVSSTVPGKPGTLASEAAAQSLSRMSPQARAEYLMHETRDFQYDRVPLNPDFPESAPLYDEIRKVKTFPLITGCAVKAGDCRCVDQQGVKVNATPSACLDFVANGRFNPYRDDRKSGMGAELAATRAAPLSSNANPPSCPPYIVYGLGGSSWVETRCFSQDQLANAPSSAALTASLGGSSGVVGAIGQPSPVAPASSMSGIQRGGVFDR